MAEYFIFVRDGNLNIKNIVDVYTKLSFVKRFNKIGSWSLELPFNSSAAQSIIEAFYEESAGNKINKGKTGIFIQRNGSNIFSGPIRFLKESWSENGHVLEVSGPDDLVWPSMRIAIPSPYGFQTSGYLQYYGQTGYADGVIKGLARVSFGPTANADRQLSFISIVANANIGYSSVASKARFENVWDEMVRAAEVSEANGYPIGISCIQSSYNATLDFDCYVPANKTSSVFFSPDIGNVLEYTYEQNTPTGNRILAGDAATGTTRQFATASNTSSRNQWGDYELFVDGSQYTAGAELNNEANKAIRENTETASFSFRPIELDGFRFQTNYNVGDKVSFRYRGLELNDIIREIKVDLSPDGEVITPVMGNRGINSGFELLNRVAQLQKRLKKRENF